MREILFRGKRIDNGEWVYGSYVYQYGCHEIFLPSVDGEYGFDHHAVDPSTIGQFTGLCDKNGKRIFEGDIIAVPFEEDRSPWEENCIYYDNGKVYFDEKLFGWYVEFNDDEISLWEYDAPELLEVEHG